MNFDVIQNENSFDKIKIEPSRLYEQLLHLRDNAEFDFDMLNQIIAVDLGVEANQFELIYDLYSTKLGQRRRISVLLDRNAPKIRSIVDIYKSAHFEECEIFDLFGIKFDKNSNLKRLYMPKGWQGYPLRKDYEQKDERLKWGEE